ncbi:MAG: DMT family transporter [Promethearchaeota archaeon]
MNDEKNIKGLLFGVVAAILVGFQPIIVSGWKIAINLSAYPENYQIPALYLFSGMTCVFEALVFLPIMLIDRKRIKIDENRNIISNVTADSLLNGWKKNKIILLQVGLTFGIGQILFTSGYFFAGSINGSIAQKSTVIFSLLFGYLIMKERISYLQIIFSLILLFGLIFTVTQGSFNIIEFNIGVLLLLILAFFWMYSHALTKKYLLNPNNSTATQIVFIRNAISSAILVSTFLLFFFTSIPFLLREPINLLYYFLMGLVYGIGLFFWYKTLSYLDASKATILVSPTPIITALFSIFILGEIFTIFHLIGSLIVIFSIIIIVYEPKKKISNKN